MSEILDKFLEYQKEKGKKARSGKILTSDEKNIIDLINLWRDRSDLRELVHVKVEDMLSKRIIDSLSAIIYGYERSCVVVHQKIKEDEARFILSEFVYYYKISFGELRELIGEKILSFFKSEWIFTTISFLQYLPSSLCFRAEKMILERDDWCRGKLLDKCYKEGTLKIRKACKKELIDDLESLYGECLDEIVDSEFAGIRDSILPPKLIKRFEDKVFDLIKEESDIGLLLRIIIYDKFAGAAEERAIFLLEKYPLDTIKSIILEFDRLCSDYSLRCFVEESVVGKIKRINPANPPAWFFGIIDDESFDFSFSDCIERALVKKAKEISKDQKNK